MSKHAKQGWPTWKIVSIAVVCAVIGTALLVLYARMPVVPVAAAASEPAPGKTPGSTPDPAQPYTNLGLSSIVILLGLMAWGVALVMVGWLGYRMYMRIPAWRRRRWFGGK
jgi:hypothetical protein